MKNFITKKRNNDYNQSKIPHLSPAAFNGQGLLSSDTQAHSEKNRLGSITYINFENGISGVDAPKIDVEANEAQNSNIYNFLGQPMGTDIESLPSGIYIQNGKKIIKR